MLEFLIEHAGYLGIVLFLVLTGCGLPVPEEVPIVVAGVFSSQGELIPELAFLSCLVGALLGDSVMYYIGYHFGHSLLLKHPRFAKFVGAQREEYFEKAIQKHSFKVLLLARFMVGIRGPVYLAAGVVRMPFRRFILCDLLCATLVVGTFFGLSYYYGSEITQFISDAEKTLTLVVLAILGAAYLLWNRRRQRMLEEALTDEQPQDWPEHEEERGAENHRAEQHELPVVQDKSA